MKTSVLAIVWVYTLVAVIAEVYAAENIPNVVTAASAVIAFALSQAAAVVLFYMNLKEEPGSLIIAVIIPLMFLAGLLISMVASLG
jgi:hypothetical protein